MRNQRKKNIPVNPGCNFVLPLQWYIDRRRIDLAIIKKVDEKYDAKEAVMIL